MTDFIRIRRDHQDESSVSLPTSTVPVQEPRPSVRTGTPAVRAQRTSLLLDTLDHFQCDPLAFMHETFLWNGDSLDPWQEDVWGTIGLELQKGHHIDAFAIASGKGAGKTTLAAQGFLWHIAVHGGKSQTLATSVTGFHARSRFWREVMKWYQRWTLREFFTPQSTRIQHVERGETWFGSHQTHNPENPEGMFGVHEDFNGFFVDEASAIPDSVLHAIKDNATGPRNFLLFISNASRSIGYFRECFRRHQHLWTTWKIDTRSEKVTRVTQEYIDRQLDEANDDENANSFKRNVRAEFPDQDEEQVVPPWLIEKACERAPIEQDTWTPITIGADIARFGSNKTVFVVRQGAYIREVYTYHQQELEDTADRLMDLIDRWRRYTMRVFVDADGLGVSVVRFCVQKGYQITEVHSAEAAFRPKNYGNKRAELYYTFRTWLRDEACLDMRTPYFEALQDQATSVYYYNDHLDRRMIEAKASMRSRGVDSPDLVDALVYSCYDKAMPRVQEMHVYI